MSSAASPLPRPKRPKRSTGTAAPGEGVSDSSDALHALASVAGSYLGAPHSAAAALSATRMGAPSGVVSGGTPASSVAPRSAGAGHPGDGVGDFGSQPAARPTEVHMMCSSCGQFKNSNKMAGGVCFDCKPPEGSRRSALAAAAAASAGPAATYANVSAATTKLIEMVR
jgi:hypothetical protein